MSSSSSSSSENISSSSSIDSSSSSVLYSSSSSSSPEYCGYPECEGSACANLTLWRLFGVTTDIGTIFVRTVHFPGTDTQQVELYEDSSYFNILALGQVSSLVPASISIEERNSSGITGTVYWDATALDYSYSAILYCHDRSTSSSSSSIDSSSESSQSVQSASSSSSQCCDNVVCEGDSCSNFSSWLFSGMSDSNSTNCTMHVGLLIQGTDQQVRIYKENTLTTLTAVGQRTGAGSITLVEQNSSGLSGSVTWDGTLIPLPNTLALSCDEFSSSSESSSSSIDSSSSSSGLFSESTISVSSSSSSSSLDSSSSSSSYGYSSESSSSVSMSSSSSPTSDSSSSSSSIDSSSTSSESIGNVSSSSSSSGLFWNQSKPLILGLSSAANPSVKNRLAQTFSLEGSTYSIGKIYVYLYQARGFSTNYYIRLSLHDCNDDGTPKDELFLQSIHASEVIKDDWYAFDFNLTDEATPTNGYLAATMRHSGDEDNFVLWAYDENIAPSNTFAWTSVDDTTWEELNNSSLAIRVVGDFEAFDSSTNAIVTPPAGSPVTTIDEITDGEITYEDTIVSFVVDSSGSMGGVDRDNNRKDIVNCLIDKFTDNYSPDSQFDITTFGGSSVDAISFSSNLGAYSTINLDLNTPTRTTYAFVVSGSVADEGAVYEIDDMEFTVQYSLVSSQVALVTYGNEDPIQSGTLNLLSGSGDATISYGSFVKTSIDDDMISYGFKNLEPNHTYNIGDFKVDSEVVSQVDEKNWQLFHSSSENPTLVVGQNSPTSGESIDIVASSTLISRKLFTNVTMLQTNLIGPLFVGNDVAEVVDASIFSVGDIIDIVQGDLANIGREITEINDNDITFSPSATLGIKVFNTSGAIVQTSLYNKTISLSGTTANILVRDVKKNRKVIFYLQNSDGYYMEWDFDAFSDWVNHNLFFFGDTANLPMSLFESDGTPFPDGTKIVLTVDKKPDIFTANETESSNISKKSFAGQTKIYLESTTGYVRGAIIDILDKSGNIQTTEIDEVDEDSDGEYIEIVDVLLFDVSVDLGTTIRLNVSSSKKLTPKDNLLSTDIIVVDVTPVVNDKDLDSSLLKPYDIERVPYSTPYEDLNTAKEFFQKDVIDMPIVDGNVCARVLPIVEDILDTVSEKESDFSRSQTYSTNTDIVSQLEQDQGDVASVQVQVDTVEETSENVDYVIETPVFTTNGEATSAMQSFATSFEEKEFDDLIIPGIDEPTFFSKDYSIYGYADFVSRKGNTLARLYLDPFEVSFITPITMYSSYVEADTVQYYLADPYAEGCSSSYARQLVRGHYASDEKVITLNYVVADKFILTNNKNITVTLYSNRIVDLESVSSSILFGTTKSSISEQFSNIRALSRNSNIDVTDTVIDRWRDIVKNNPFEEVIDSINQLDISTSNEDSQRESVRDDILNQYTDILGGTLSGSASSSASLFYTDPAEWTLAKQYDTYEFTIPIVNGKATLEIPTSNKVHLLFVEASVTFGENDEHEQVLSDAFFVSNPITIAGISPEGISPVENEIYEIGTNIEYLDNSSTIDDNVQVNYLFQNSSFNIEPTSSVTDNGWAGGVFIGPLEIIEPELTPSDSDSICPPRKIIDVEIEVFHPLGYVRKAKRSIDLTYSTINEEDGTFLFFAEDASQSLYANGSLSADAKITIDLDDAFNPTELYVGVDGVSRLKGLDQPDGARVLTAFNSSPRKTKWESNVITLTAVPRNKNIGHVRPLGESETFKEPWSSQVNAYTSYRTSTGVFRKGEIASGLPIVSGNGTTTPKPLQRYVEPLGITLGSETSYARDGSTSSLIYAELTWEGNVITNKVTLNSGTESESIIEYPLPKVVFESGISKIENLNLGAINTAKDDRNLIDGCLIVEPHKEISLSDYSVQSRLIRSDIHIETDGLGAVLSTHTHVTGIDEDGNGRTTSTIVLSGTFDDHEHTFTNYESDEILGHSHGLRCVAMTTINPTSNIDTDFVINGTVIYDPTNSLPYRDEPTNPEGNRKMFATLRLPAGTELAKRLVSKVELGNDLDNSTPIFTLDYTDQENSESVGSNDASATFYTADSIEETIKGFDVRVFVKFPEYVYLDEDGVEVVVPEEIVPDGARVTMELTPYKPEADSGETDPGFLVMGSGVKRDYINLRVKISVSYDGYLSERKFTIAIASTKQWYPIVKHQTPGLTNDSIRIAEAIDNFGFFGASQVHDAVKQAAQQLVQYQTDDSKYKDYKKTIVLITDGDENSSENSVNQAIESIDFVDGKGEIQVIPIQVGPSHASDSMILKKYGDYGKSTVFLMNDSSGGQIDAICDSIVSGDNLTINQTILTGEITFDSLNMPSTTMLDGVTVPTGATATYRIRTSSDGVDFSSWSSFIDYSIPYEHEQSIDSLQSVVQYEIKLLGNETFGTPTLSGVELQYYSPREFLIFFQPIQIDILDSEYISSIHITSESDIPDTSTVEFLMSQSDSLNPEEYYNVIPDQHTVLPTRFNELMETTNFRSYIAVNGRWNANATIEVYKLEESATQGVKMPNSSFSANSVDGTVTFLSSQDPSVTIFINIFFNSSFRIATKVTNYAGESATIHHMGVMYNVSKRIPYSSDGTIVHVPISKRLTE